MRTSTRPFSGHSSARTPLKAPISMKSPRFDVAVQLRRTVVRFKSFSQGREGAKDWTLPDKGPVTAGEVETPAASMSTKTATCILSSLHPQQAYLLIRCVALPGLHLMARRHLNECSKSVIYIQKGHRRVAPIACHLPPFLRYRSSLVRLGDGCRVCFKYSS